MARVKAGWIEKPREGADGLDPEYLPGPQAVAARAVCLLTVQLRCMAEFMAAEDPRGAAELWASLRDGFESLNLGDELLESERALIDADVGAADAQAIMDATWDVESLAVLLWALGRLPSLPAFDTKIDIDAVLAASPSGADQTRRFIDDAKLRPAEELEHEEWRSFHWLWRIRAMPRAGRNILSPNARSANDAHAPDFPEDTMADGDLLAFGQPLFRLALASEELKTLRSVIELRAHALRWLTRGNDEWEDVAMDT